jgi:hypothetical protein
MAYAKKAVRALYGSKLGKLLPVLVVAGLMATASATVFVVYYGSATATVASSDLTLVAGADASGSCSTYPCATVAIASTNDFATIGVNFAASATDSPQPSTYYTNLLKLHNGGTGSHTIQSITISGVTDSSSSLGSITMYYCTAQTDAPAGSASCASFAITNTSGGSLSGNSILPQSLAAGSTGYFEVIAYAASSATAGHTVTFNLQVQWV